MQSESFGALLYKLRLLVYCAWVIHDASLDALVLFSYDLNFQRASLGVQGRQLDSWQVARANYFQR